MAETFGIGGFTMAELLDRLQRPAAHNVTGRESMASMMLVAAEALQKQSSKLQALEQFKEWAEPQIADRGELLSRLQALTKDAERADEVRLEQLRAAERLIDSQRSRLEQYKSAMARCVLNDPPGDCYAAEVVELRSRLESGKKLVADLVAWILSDETEQPRA